MKPEGFTFRFQSQRVLPQPKDLPWASSSNSQQRARKNAPRSNPRNQPESSPFPYHSRPRRRRSFCSWFPRQNHERSGHELADHTLLRDTPSGRTSPSDPPRRVGLRELALGRYGLRADETRRSLGLPRAVRDATSSGVHLGPALHLPVHRGVLLPPPHHRAVARVPHRRR